MHTLPSEITVTIYVKFIESLKAATLDINDSTLMFKYPEVYYLDINLCYKVDKLNGNAKFDKNKKTLTVRVPVTGSTDDSAKVLEKHFKDYKENHARTNIKNLEISKLDGDIERRFVKNKGGKLVDDKVEEDETEATEVQRPQRKRTLVNRTLSPTWSLSTRKVALVSLNLECS